MAYGNPGPQEDMYEDGGSDEQHEGQESEKEGTSKSYPLPKEVLEGKDFKPGDELVLKIDAIHDDMIEVSYAPAKEQEKSGEGEHEEMGEPESAQAGGMSSMYE